ncbi:MAG: MFS transporter [Deltaproteobacteria bacterium]|nr:MFS transporter [Deltaproteobacteria bacterium]
MHRPFSVRGDYAPAVINGVFSLGTSAANFFLPLYFRDQLGFSGTQIGALFATQAIAGVLAVLPAGLGNDRVTSRTLVGASLIVQAIAFTALAMVRSFPVYLLVFFGWAVGFNLYRISLDVQLLKTDQGAGVERRALLYQFVRFGGLALGTAGAGYVLARIDFRGALMAMALVCAALALTAFALVPVRVARVRFADYRADIRRPNVLLFAGWFFLFATHWGAEYTCYGLFLRENLGLSVIQIGWYMTGEFAAIVVTLAVLLARRVALVNGAVRRFAVAGLALSGVGHIGMSVTGPLVSAAFRMIHGAGDGLIVVVLYLGLARLFHVERAGGNTGFVNLAAMAGLVAGSLITGPIGERYGYQWPILASGVMILALIVPLILPIRERSAQASGISSTPARS